MGLEAAARQIRHYETMLIPGLLQSPEYMAAVFESKPGRAAQEVARKVSLRLERQRLLSRRRPVAPTFEAIIDEAVIRRPIADVEAWRRQLAHTVNAAQAPNVSVRIVPQSAGPHMVFVASAFIFLDSPALGTRPAEPSTIYSASLTGSLYLDGPNELETYSEAWQALSALALDERESEDLIGRVIKETYDE